MHDLNFEFPAPSMSMFANQQDYKEFLLQEKIKKLRAKTSAFPNDSSNPPFARTIIKEGNFPATTFIVVFFYQDEETGLQYKRLFDGKNWTLKISSDKVEN
jgi:hypothetical protein